MGCFPHQDTCVLSAFFFFPLIMILGNSLTFSVLLVLCSPLPILLIRTSSMARSLLCSRAVVSTHGQDTKNRCRMSNGEQLCGQPSMQSWQPEVGCPASYPRIPRGFHPRAASCIVTSEGNGSLPGLLGGFIKSQVYFTSFHWESRSIRRSCMLC